MNLIKNEIKIGAKKPFTVLHLSDTHLTLADSRDGERKNALSLRRSKGFLTAENDLMYTEALAKQSGFPVFHTGDLIDFTSEANFERGKSFIQNTGCILAAGNHEFSKFVGEAKEDDAYKTDSLPKVLNMLNRSSLFCGTVINGVNFVVTDNSYYDFNSFQLDFVKNEVKKELPVVLLMHTPLYEEQLFNKMMQQDNSAYLAGVPEERMQGYPKDRYIQQLANKETLEFINFVHNEPLIRLILAGHTHFDSEGMVFDRIPQLVTGIGTLREITLT